MANWHIKLAIAFVAGYFATENMGQIEGHFLPVVTSVEVTKLEPAENGYTRIYGSFRIDRPNCQFQALTWKLKGKVRDVYAEVVFEGGTREREGGLNDFGPWRVQLTEDQLTQSSLAVVYHKCPWRWWKTETEFYSQG